MLDSLIDKEEDLSGVALDLDQKAVALRATKDLIHGASYIYEMVKNDTLTVEMRDNMCSLLDYYLKELCEPVGYASQAAARIEEKHADIRRLNDRIHELERQLGEAAPIDTVPNLLRNLYDDISEWWRAQFGGWIHDLDFGPYGTVHAKFHFSFDFIYTGSKTPVSDKSKKEQTRESLEEQGYIFVLDDRTHHMLDCDKNRELLMKLLTEKFPSITIRYWENRHVHKSRAFALWGIVVVIQNIKDLGGGKVEHVEHVEQAPG